jgi:hypothetical protein
MQSPDNIYMRKEQINFRLKCLEIAVLTMQDEKIASFEEHGDIPSVPDELHTRAEAIARYACQSYPAENRRNFHLN